MRSLPPLTALRAFEAVGRTGSVAGAATELGVSPGAVSQHIHRLEAHLGATLLQRQGRGLVLSRAGAAYHAEIGRAFDIVEAAGAALSRARDGSGLKLSALTSVVIKWVGRRIFDWQAQFPDAVVHLSAGEAEPDLDRDETDFRIYYGGRRHPPYHAELFTDWVVPACAPALIAERGAPPTAEEILASPLLHVVWSPAFMPGPGWADWAASVGAAPPGRRAGLTYTLSSSAIDAAADGRGFVLAQMSLIADELAQGRLVIPFDHRLPLPEPYFLGWSEAALRKPFAGDFHRWLLAVGRAQGARSAPAVTPPHHRG